MEGKEISSTENHYNLLTCFSIFWSFSTLSHLVIWPEWSKHSIPLGWLLCALCILHIVTFGKHKILFVSTVLCSTFWYLLREPFGVNHLFYEAIVSLALSTILIIYYFNKKTNSFNTYFVENAIPLLRTFIIILYFFVVLHKLNYDYFDIEISCGAVLFENLIQNLKLTKFGFVNSIYANNSILFAYISVYSAILLEGIIPLLLIFKKTRKIGVIIGLLFHFLLGFEGLGAIISFTAMMFTYLILFWDNATTERFMSLIGAYKSKLRVCFVLIIIILVMVYTFVSERVFKETFGIIWIIYSISIILIYVQISNLKKPSYSLEFITKNSTYYIFTFCLLLNGFSPYLGLKTQTVFSMFSNLKTENATNNHFFIPETLQIFNYQKEVVSIIDTDMTNLVLEEHWNNTTEYKLVLFEFIKKINSIEDGFVKFTVNNKNYSILKKEGRVIESNVNLNQSLILKKLLLFRPIYDQINYCQQ